MAVNGTIASKYRNAGGPECANRILVKDGVCDAFMKAVEKVEAHIADA